MDAGSYRVPRRRLSIAGAVMRMWLGVVLLFAGLGLAIAHFRSPEATGDIEQVIQNIQAERPTSIEASRKTRTAGERRVARQANSLSPTDRNLHIVSAPWDRQEIFIGRQGDLRTDAESAAPMNRYELTRALQTELRRVGCYYGEIDGDWGPGSKRAMGAFTGRVNASLPVDVPDAILLTMVQRFEGTACGSTCRSGEVFTGEGRCVPATIVAQDRSPVRGDALAERSLPALGGSVMVQPPVSPAPAGENPRVAAVEPLPGRMSVGAPVDDANGEDSAVTTASVTAAPRPRADTRPRSPAPSYRSSSTSRKRWTQTIFDDIAARN